jgi:hypothetical protein
MRVRKAAKEEIRKKYFVPTRPSRRCPDCGVRIEPGFLCKCGEDFHSVLDLINAEKDDDFKITFE